MSGKEKLRRLEREKQLDMAPNKNQDNQQHTQQASRGMDWLLPNQPRNESEELMGVEAWIKAAEIRNEEIGMEKGEMGYRVACMTEHWGCIRWAVVLGSDS